MRGGVVGYAIPIDDNKTSKGINMFALRLTLFLCKVAVGVTFLFLFLYLISHAQLFDAWVINSLGRG
jgi:hypothetical protein